jgi:hypothetical protein
MIELYADRTRALPLVDPFDRALTISCGAAISRLQIAIRHFGYACRAELLPDSNYKVLVARVLIDGRKETIREDNSLFETITKRRTKRLKFEDREVQEPLISNLWSTLTNKEGEEVG